jgi:hypothetical protein
MSRIPQSGSRSIYRYLSAYEDAVEREREARRQRLAAFALTALCLIGIPIFLALLYLLRLPAP